jgi:hypothetical protein
MPDSVHRSGGRASGRLARDLPYRFLSGFPPGVRPRLVSRPALLSGSRLTINRGVGRAGFEPATSGFGPGRGTGTPSARASALPICATSPVSARRSGASSFGLYSPRCTGHAACDGWVLLPHGACASGAGGSRGGEESNLQHRLRPGVDPWRRGVTDPVTCRAETPCSAVELPPHVQVAPHAVSHLELRCTSWRPPTHRLAARPKNLPCTASLSPTYGDQVDSLETDGVDLFPSSGRWAARVVSPEARRSECLWNCQASIEHVRAGQLLDLWLPFQVGTAGPPRFHP